MFEESNDDKRNNTQPNKNNKYDGNVDLRIDGCNSKLCEKNPNLAIIIRYC